ncbi:helix-turn-helix domain-containing protein [Anatilimnocola floriformis]|uniref:helix-turn-helix domain-containing protein n=1 Tax=Anatilimnocola floriformis TaxID=2948575 RepID=UPI0036F398B3
MQKSTHTNDYRKLRAALVEVRTAAGLTQRELATILRVQPSWVAKVETGERRIDVLEFCWYVRACNGDPAATIAEFSATKGAKGNRAS